MPGTCFHWDGLQSALFVWGIPVSYTHLDVYKRQGLPTYQISSNSEMVR